MSKYLESVSTDHCELEVYECWCGYHIGFDATHLDQVDKLAQAVCPACGAVISTKGEGDIKVFTAIALECPWHSHAAFAAPHLCHAVSHNSGEFSRCTMENCAIWHFLKKGESNG